MLHRLLVPGLICLAAAAAAPAPVPAVPPSCARTFLGDAQPTVRQAAMGVGDTLLCGNGAAVLTSAITRGAIWTAEHVTASETAQALRAGSADGIRADPRLIPTGRAEPADYGGTDLVPVALSSLTLSESVIGAEGGIVLSDAVPVLPEIGRRLWPVFNRMVQHMAARADEVWIVSGVAYAGPRVRALSGRVLVPSAIWRAIYDPTVPGVAGAWFCRNSGGTDCRILSIEQLTVETGIDPFPALPKALRATARSMPQPGALLGGFPIP